MRTSLPNLYFPVIADMAVKRYLNIFIFHGYFTADLKTQYRGIRTFMFVKADLGRLQARLVFSNSLPEGSLQFSS